MLQSPERKWEEDVRNLVGSLGFTNQITPENKGTLQVDSAGGEQDTYFEFDATVTADPAGKYSSSERIRERKKRIRRFVESNFPNKYKEFIHVIWIKGSVSETVRKVAHRGGFRLLSEQTYKSFRSRSKNLDKLTEKGHRVDVQRSMLRYQLMKQLDVKLPVIIAKEIKALPAVKYHYGHGKFAYAFALNPETLAKVCYVLKREEVGKPGYQRLLDESRIPGIAEHIRKTKDSFPNNIIINFDERKIKEVSCKRSKEPGIFNCIISLPETYCSAQLIDGQHRLFAFEDLHGKDERLRRELKLDILAFSKLSEQDSARIFIDLNKEQKRIDPSLYWEIVGDYLKSTPEGAISEVVKNLGSRRGGIFRNEVQIPSRAIKGAEIKLANFCKGISDRHLIFGANEKQFTNVERKHYAWNFFVRARCNTKKTITLAEEQINHYFKLLTEHRSSKHWKEFVMTNTGLNIMLRVLVEILKWNQLAKQQQNLNRSYKMVLAAMGGYIRSLTKEEIEKRMRTSSEGARGDWAQDIFSSIHKRIPLFALESLSQKKITEYTDTINSLTRRTIKKREAYKGLIATLIEINSFDKARRISKRMHKEFEDLYSKRMIESLESKNI